MGPKKNIVRLNFLLSIGFGIIVGIIFPFYAHFFVVYKSSSLQQLFIIGSISAGIAVGITAFLITRFTILHVIKMVSKEMESIAEGDAD
ncbi:MAG: hypothetical protein J7K04_08010, partial [Spirochaetales bacterium]|nr:hypothetical protein [Spirochaetales bacterium]